MRRFTFWLLAMSIIILSSCKKKRNDDNNNNPTPPQTANIQGDWVGKWIVQDGSVKGIIHLSIDQVDDSVNIKIVFDSMYTDTFVMAGKLDEDHISGYAYSTHTDTFKCIFSLTYDNDTLRGTYNFGIGSTGSWWAVKGTHLVEIGWNYFGSVNGYPNDVFYSSDGMLYVASTVGLFASQDYGITYELVDTTGFYSMCDADGILYTTYFGKVIKSNDGGNTWEDITPSGFTGGSGTIIRFRSSSEGYIITGDDVYYTSDGGSTWTLHEDVLPGLAQGACVTSSGVYVVGRVPGQTYGGFAVFSRDNGASWTEFDVATTYEVAELWSVYADGNKILLGGKKYKSNTDDHDLRILLYSEDNGNTFEKETFPGVPEHDEWIGTVIITGNTLFAGNVYPSGDLIVYSFSSSAKADTIGFTGSSSKALLNYGDGNMGLVVNTAQGNIAVFYYRSN